MNIKRRKRGPNLYKKVKVSRRRDEPCKKNRKKPQRGEHSTFTNWVENTIMPTQETPSNRVGKAYQNG